MDAKNKLYFGDNLKILREYVADASVDLIYLDPPFNSSASYNVLFKEKSGDSGAGNRKRCKMRFAEVTTCGIKRGGYRGGRRK